MSQALRGLWRNDRWRCALLCAAAFLLLWPGISEQANMQWGVRYFWLLLLPVIIRVREPGVRSLRYAFVLGPLLLLSAWSAHPMFRFLALFATVFLLVEAFIGKLDRLAPLFAVLVAPITHYFFNTFGFHVRLAISSAVAHTLRLMDAGAVGIGNTLLFKGQEFHVDPECMGLRMITTSLIVAMALIALMERRKHVALPGYLLPVLLAATFVLVAGCNYMRIIALVLTEAPAGGSAHELIGLLCWFLLVLIPLLYLTDRATARAIPVPTETIEQTWPTWKRSLASLVLAPVALLAWTQPTRYVETERDALAETWEIPGCERSVLGNHVVRFENPELLVYIKPGKPFYSDDHHPMSCWLGSGFHFAHEVVEPFRDGEICRGLLSNGNDVRYSAWWYENGTISTCDQLTWRWHAMQGHGPFRLVNVTATSPQVLMREVSRIFGKLPATRVASDAGLAAAR